ncbi:hypothetical protein MVES1_001877 [Malassezia vespertilionis]|uniref:Acid phosphatase n=1 Tax=Malassezia vespertilionis TaxID=2020962 RepID=A0A2N1JDM9_9BASI|nr:uncharacterized protein MVES1_001877 [Malassezia vespertilionis]PKI84653.1 hypothetical protein MVES_001779 [Malassezia vespertilionis]WFD06528.1 hypothetical protein MVES1_001877 [Malassezia vespertilionis]
MAAFLSLLPFVAAAVAFAQSPSATVSWNNVTGTANQAFPTDVGFLGTMGYGEQPYNAQNDKLNSSEFLQTYGIETRWKPKDADQDKANSDDIFRNLGTTSPYRAADDLFPETNQYRNLPDECVIKQVHVVHRHGARYPTSETSEGAPMFGEVIANATKDNKLGASGDLDFLKQWKYPIGAEVLVHQGAQELFDSGVKMFYDYGKLLDNKTDHKIVVRTTSQSRMLDSARYWTLGFFGWNAPQQVDIEVLTEYENQNNSLAPYEVCTNSNKDSFRIGDALAVQWREKYTADAVKRLQPMLKGVKLNAKLVYGMMSLCAYETVGVGYSNFCNLFTKKEYEGYEYDIDLQFQGDYGFMNPTGKAQGVSLANEVIDRMSQTEFDQAAGLENTTLNKNKTYFPVDQRLYVDFTHDDVIQSLLTAFNYSQVADYLPIDKPDPNRRYRSSRVTPFGARLVFEVMDCGKSGNATRYLRTKINEAVVPMDQDQGCSETKPNGLCKFNEFINHQKQNAIKDAKFQLVCFGKNGTDFTVTGPVTNGTV